MGHTYREVLAEKMKDPEFKAEWEAQEPEFQLIKAMIDARTNQNLSQRQLSEKTGITQSDICKIESGEANPTLQTLKRLAAGLGMSLDLRFKPLGSVK